MQGLRVSDQRPAERFNTFPRGADGFLQHAVFQARFKRLAPRRGEKRTTMAVAHLMLLISKRQRVPSVPGLTLAVQ